MKAFLFLTSICSTTLVSIFMWTSISLVGYRSDFYFFLGSLIINFVSFLVHFNYKTASPKAFLSLAFAILQLIGLMLFLWADTLQVDKVYKQQNAKHNLYSSAIGWYKLAYYKPHQGELCNDGELWETKVPSYFPLLEIEISRDQCHKFGSNGIYESAFKYVPE